MPYTAPAVEYISAAPAVEYITAPPAVEYITSAPAVEYVSPAPMAEYIQQPAPVVEYIAPRPQIGVGGVRNLLAMGNVVSERRITPEELFAEGRFIEAPAERAKTTAPMIE